MGKVYDDYLEAQRTASDAQGAESEARWAELEALQAQSEASWVYGSEPKGNEVGALIVVGLGFYFFGLVPTLVGIVVVVLLATF